jgi:hypothetical protein
VKNFLPSKENEMAGYHYDKGGWEGDLPPHYFTENGN